MKTELMILRILTFILLPISAMFGFMDIILLLSSIRNPAQLFPVFLIAAFVIYVFATLRFITRHIDTGQPARPSLRDWIRVNGFASLALAGLSLLSSITLVVNGDEKLREVVKDMLEMQQMNTPGMPDADALVSTIKLAIWFMVCVAVLLIIHATLNFRVMRRYRYLFGGTTLQP